MNYLPAFLAGAALLSACSGTPNNAASATSTAVPDVAQLNQEFLGAWNSKDADKASALLADDAQFLQGQTHFSGKSEVAEKWIKATIGTIADLKTEVVSSGAGSAVAYQAGRFSANVLPTAAQPAQGQGEGNFVLLWKRDGGGNWKLALAQLEDLPVQVRR